MAKMSKYTKQSNNTSRQTEASNKDVSKMTIQTPLDPAFAPTLVNLARELSKTQKPAQQDIGYARDALGFVGEHIASNPVMAADLRPTGAWLEMLYPNLKGISKYGAPSPYIDKAIDVGDKLLQAESRQQNAEANLLGKLLVNQQQTGTTGMHTVNVGSQNESTRGTNPVGAGGAGGLGQQRLDNQMSEARYRKRKDFGESLNGAMPFAGAVHRMGGILGREGVLKWNKSKKRFEAPGAEGWKKIFGPGGLARFGEKTAAELYLAASNVQLLRGKMISGTAMGQKERNRIDTSMGLDWKANSDLMFKAYDDNLEAMARHLEHSQKTYGMQAASDYYGGSEEMTPAYWRSLKTKGIFSGTSPQTKNRAPGGSANSGAGPAKKKKKGLLSDDTSSFIDGL